MDLLRSVDDVPSGARLFATVGVFDGLHRGHHAALAATVAAARDAAAVPTVITFQPHPDTVLRGVTPPLLCDPDERVDRMRLAGIGIVVLQPFDRAFADQSAEEFLARLARGRELAGLVMTPESAFGRDRHGTRDVVGSIAAKMRFAVVEVPPLQIDGARVSSSRIRAEIEAGRLAAARRLLGRDYAVRGTVVHGDGRGRQLGYPTANLRFDAPAALPPNGVYAVRVGWGGTGPLAPRRAADGVASLGVRPTFGGGDRVLEVHLFEFDEDLYGERLRVELVRRQRGERRFSDISALVRQMDRDSARAREILAASRGHRRDGHHPATTTMSRDSRRGGQLGTVAGATAEASSA